MIIDGMIDLGMVLLEWLLGLFDIPEMPDQVQTVVDTFVDYLSAGLALLQNFVHLDYLLLLFGVVVAWDACILAYKGVMWVLRKIPMLGIE